MKPFTHSVGASSRLIAPLQIFPLPVREFKNCILVDTLELCKRSIACSNRKIEVEMKTMCPPGCSRFVICVSERTLPSLPTPTGKKVARMVG